MSNDGYIKVYETNKRVSGGRAIDIYERIYAKWDEVELYFNQEIEKVRGK